MEEHNNQKKTKTTTGRLTHFGRTSPSTDYMPRVKMLKRLIFYFTLSTILTSSKSFIKHYEIEARTAGGEMSVLCNTNTEIRFFSLRMTNYNGKPISIYVDSPTASADKQYISRDNGRKAMPF